MSEVERFAGCLKEDGIDAMLAMEGRLLERGFTVLIQWGHEVWLCELCKVSLKCDSKYDK